MSKYFLSFMVLSTLTILEKSLREGYFWVELLEIGHQLTILKFRLFRLERIYFSLVKFGKKKAEEK